MLNQQRRQILNWVVANNQKHQQIFIVQVPQISTGILLEKGVQIKFGSASERKLDYTMCASNQCQASAPIDRSLKKDLLAAKNAVVTITSAAGQAVNIKISDIKGTDRAIAALGR